MSRIEAHDTKSCEGYKGLLIEFYALLASAAEEESVNDGDRCSHTLVVIQKALKNYQSKCPSLQCASTGVRPYNDNVVANLNSGAVSEAPDREPVASEQNDGVRTNEKSSVTLEDGTRVPANLPPNVYSAFVRVNRMPVDCLPPAPRTSNIVKQSICAQSSSSVFHLSADDAEKKENSCRDVTSHDQSDCLLATSSNIPEPSTAVLNSIIKVEPNDHEMQNDVEVEDEKCAVKERSCDNDTAMVIKNEPEPTDDLSTTTDRNIDTHCFVFKSEEPTEPSPSSCDTTAADGNSENCTAFSYSEATHHTTGSTDAAPASDGNGNVRSDPVSSTQNNGCQDVECSSGSSKDINGNEDARNNSNPSIIDAAQTVTSGQSSSDLPRSEPARKNLNACRKVKKTRTILKIQVEKKNIERHNSLAHLQPSSTAAQSSKSKTLRKNETAQSVGSSPAENVTKRRSARLQSLGTQEKVESSTAPQQTKAEVASTRESQLLGRSKEFQADSKTKLEKPTALQEAEEAKKRETERLRKLQEPRAQGKIEREKALALREAEEAKRKQAERHSKTQELQAQQKLELENADALREAEEAEKEAERLRSFQGLRDLRKIEAAKVRRATARVRRAAAKAKKGEAERLRRLQEQEEQRKMEAEKAHREAEEAKKREAEHRKRLQALKSMRKIEHEKSIAQRKAEEVKKSEAEHLKISQEQESRVATEQRKIEVVKSIGRRQAEEVNQKIVEHSASFRAPAVPRLQRNINENSSERRNATQAPTAGTHNSNLPTLQPARMNRAQNFITNAHAGTTTVRSNDRTIVNFNGHQPPQASWPSVSSTFSRTVIHTNNVQQSGPSEIWRPPQDGFPFNFFPPDFWRVFPRPPMYHGSQVYSPVNFTFNGQMPRFRRARNNFNFNRRRN